jgi:D-alanyl-D-alanine carboxypeptidase
MHVSRRPTSSPPAGSAFSQRLQFLLQQLNIPLTPGPAADAYLLRFIDEPNIYVMSAASGTVLHAACEAAVLPPAPPSAMLSGLLALNHRPSGDLDATVSLDTRTGTVAVSSRHLFSAVDSALLNTIVNAIRRKTNDVQGVLTGSSAANLHRPAHRSWRG